MNNYCEFHKNNIAISKCQKCSRRICKRCLNTGSSFCQKCSGISIAKIEKGQSKKKLRNITIFGFILGIVGFFINYFSDNYLVMTLEDILLSSFMFLVLGVSFGSAFYFIKDSNYFDEILDEIPFFGKKIIKYIFIGSSLIGLPLIYYFFLIYRHFKVNK